MTIRKRWGRDPRCWVLWSGVLGLAIGAWISWYINRPWLEIFFVSATYRAQWNEILLEGYLDVNRECDGDTTLRTLLDWLLTGREPVHVTPVWRNQAIATDGEVALYAPIPDPPPLTKGEHRFSMTIPVLEGIFPVGWLITIAVTCSGESPETAVSRQTSVIVLDVEETPP